MLKELNVYDMTGNIMNINFENISIFGILLSYTIVCNMYKNIKYLHT